MNDISLSSGIVVLSPVLSQAQTIARVLREHRTDLMIVGAPLIGEGLPSRRAASCFNCFVDASDLLAGGWPSNMLVIPTGSESTEWLLRKSGPEIRLGQIAMSERMLETQNKLLTLTIAAELSVPVPTTWLDIDDIPAGTAVFYKTTSEGLKGERSWSSDRAHLPGFVREGGYMFQERIEGEGTFGFAFVAQNGEVLVETQHHEILSMPKDGGSAVLIRSVNVSRVRELSRRLIAHWRYSGWGLVEFKFCPRRQDFVLMEINAKFWASLDFSLRVEPRLAKLLFGCDAGKSKQHGQLWLDRAASAGPTVLWQALIRRRRGDRMVWEGPCLPPLIRHFSPVALRRWLRPAGNVFRRATGIARPKSG